MKSGLIPVAAMMAAGALCASVPEVNVTSVTQDASRLVTVEYTLSAPAVVTFDVKTNNLETGEWESIGEKLTHYTGDAMKFIASAEGVKRITWQPRHSWPNQKIDGGNVKVDVTAWAPDAPPDYMAVNLLVPGTVNYYPSAGSVPGGVTNPAYKTTVMLLRKIPAEHATFRIGCAGNEHVDNNMYNQFKIRETAHLVSFTRDYYIGVYPVTQAQYRILSGGDNPSIYKGANYPEADLHPAENVNWYDFRGEGSTWPEGTREVTGGVLMALRNLAGSDFDLPTEAQWEFACRAGTETPAYNGALTVENIDKIAWHGGNSFNVAANKLATRPVGLLEPNAWGLYDMIGNVYEWCLDWAADFTAAAATDPAGPAEADAASITGSGGGTGPVKVLRGASHLIDASDRTKIYQFRSAWRYFYNAPGRATHQTGARVACPAEAKR